MDVPPAAEDDAFQLRIQLLGKFVVWVGGERIADEQWRLRRARSLIKLLALTPTHRLHRDQVADTLWPDSDLTASANNFHQTLYAARKVLGGGEYLRLEEGFLRLCGEKGQAVWVDVEQFERSASVAKESQDPARYQIALELYQGDLLPEDLYEEWIVPRREALRQQHLGLLLELAQLLEARREYPRAIEAVERLLAADRGNEEGHTQLMRLYALSGKRGQALRQYQALREALQEELEAEPGAAAKRLYEEIQANRFPPVETALPPVSVPPLASSAGPRHNLTAQLTSFIGREQVIVAVCNGVKQQRLVTITGSGGVGKTRLALQVAEKLLEPFAQGVWLVELAPLSDPALVEREVADTLGVHEQPGQDLHQALTGFLRSGSQLLLLDNCEHVIEATANLVTQLLQACPQLRILATSREILDVAGEVPFRCPSLSLPENQSPTVEELAQSEAVRLFVERVETGFPAFALSEANAAPVAQICQRLDGIPLAIELAAARTRMLSVEQIAGRLDQAFRLLTGGSRSALPRHQTLKALIDWSYNLLSPAEQALLLRLSVFAGGWTLEAAEKVCADPEGETGPIRLQTEQVVDLLGELIDKSLIQFESSRKEEPHYRMLETVRQYARERLVESGGEATLRERHLDYFLSQALQAEPHLRAHGAKDWLDRLERELDNLRLALGWSLTGSIEKGLQFAACLLWFWHIRSHILEGMGWLERLLQAQGRQRDLQDLDTAGKAARGRALNVLSYIISNVDNNPPRHLVLQKGKFVQESQTIFQELGEAYLRDYAISRYLQAETAEDFLECHSRFQALNDLFWMSECDHALTNTYPLYDDRAFFYCNEYLALTKEIGDLDGEGSALRLLGFVEGCRGNADRMVELTSECLACLEAIGNRRYVALIRGYFAFDLIAQGNYQEALHQSELAFAVGSELNDPSFFDRYYNRQAIIAWGMGEYGQAVRYCEAALEFAKDRWDANEIFTLYILGRIALSQGELARAREYLKRVFQQFLFLDYSDDLCFHHAHFAVGMLAALEKQMQRAVTLFGAREALLEQHSLVFIFPLFPPERSEYEQALTAARAALDEEAFRAAWQAGRAMNSEQVTHYALDFIDEKPPAR